jgi:hypothetical protein
MIAVNWSMMVSRSTGADGNGMLTTMGVLPPPSAHIYMVNAEEGNRSGPSSLTGNSLAAPERLKAGMTPNPVSHLV